jgi:hypothetical protein
MSGSVSSIVLQITFAINSSDFKQASTTISFPCCVTGLGLNGLTEIALTIPPEESSFEPPEIVLP